ncbi:MAG: hypothetical protein KAR03_08840, partial [Candidatus Thorarchaeota archaeon]|nr:hypothetical protein [Candidatus Thorarchaeota archaeon]
MRERKSCISIQQKINSLGKKRKLMKLPLLSLALIILLMHTVLLIPSLVPANDLRLRESNPIYSREGESSDFVPGESVLSENGEWVRFIEDSDPGTRSKILSKSRDTMGLCVDSTFYGMYNYSETIASIRFNILNVPSCGHASEIGKPAVPLVTRYLEVPYDVNITVRVLYDVNETLTGYYVIPAQTQRVDSENATIPDFEYDNTTYFADTFYPENIATVDGGSLSDGIVVRGHRIVALTLYPVQFNPVQRQVRVFSKIEVRLDYSRPAQVEAVPSRLQSDTFSDFCKGLILNYEYNPGFQLMKATGNQYPESNGYTSTLAQARLQAEYLIIVNDTFYNDVLPLADWKEKKGLITKVVKTSEIDLTTPTTPTANQVASYIQTAYDTWNPAPSYVLLVGDSDHILPHYRTVTGHTAVHGFFDTATDLYYGTVDGTDYFPDIFVGRISVDTTGELNTIVDKILNYERTPPDPATFPEYYSNIAACAYFEQGVVVNTERSDYIRTSEDILRLNTYNGLESMGYIANRIYDTNAVNPQWYRDTTNLPNDLLMANGFLWDGDAADITGNLTEGRFLMYHRDHGASSNCFDHGTGWFRNVDGWNHPPYEVNDITGLANGQLLPLVLSIECQCGWYDGEVDQETWGGGDADLTRDVESYCEEFVRHAGGGAIAAIGASRNSPTSTNDIFLKGIIDAIWPTFDSDFNSGGLYSFAQLMVYGKVYTAHFTTYNDP